MNFLRWLVMFPIAFILGTIISGLLTDFFGSFLRYGVATSVIITLMYSLVSARLYMGVGIFIAPEKNLLTKIVLAIPYFSIICFGTGLLTFLIAIIGDAYFPSVTVLPAQWESIIYTIGTFLGLALSFASKNRN